MSFARQLDFFSRLVARVVLPLSPKVAPSPVAPTAVPRVPRSKMMRGEDEMLTARCRDLLGTVAAAELAARVRVRWNSRMRSTAGTAYPSKSLITLNPRLREFGEEELDRTLRHELAHLLAHHRAGRRRIAPHGSEWRRACEDLGLHDERRCHDLPLPRRQMAARHFYRCPNCAMELRRVRPLRGRSACLVCCRAHNGGRYDERFRFAKIKG